MLYTCPRCSAFRPDMTIDGERSLAVCPECGYERLFRRTPLFAIGGASGSGKTAICRLLAGKVPGVICLDGDIFWDKARFSAGDPGAFYEYALRVAMNIAQSGQIVAIFNAGFGVPGNLEGCVARRYFSEMNYLGLYCSDDELERRLRARPGASDGFIAAMKGFNALFRSGGAAPNVMDTSRDTTEETGERVRSWIMGKL